jgi:hypothetical protein
MSIVALIALLAAAVVLAWRLLRAYPLAVLATVAVAGWLGHHGMLGTPEPVREAASSVEAWREDRITALRCRAAVLAAITSDDDERALARLEAECALRPQLEAAAASYRLDDHVAAHRYVRIGTARTVVRGGAPARSPRPDR